MNSAKRDMLSYPNGNVYSLDLLTPLKNITKVELMSARVPNTIYNIINGSGALTVSNTLSTYSISLPNGFWDDPDKIASELAKRIHGSSINIDWLSSEGLFIMYSTQTDPFKITVNSSDLSRLIGFPVGVQLTMSPYPQTIGQAQDLVGILPAGTQQYIKSTTVADFSKNDYIFVDVQEFRNMGLNELSSLPLSGKTTTNMFTALTLDVPANSVKIFKNSDYPVVVEYDPPISKITRLTIGWYDSDANLINFQGLEDNVLMFRVTTKPDVPVTEIEHLQTPDDMLFYDSRPPVPIPKPKEVREKRVIGKWFFYMGIIGILLLWFIRRRSSLPGRL